MPIIPHDVCFTVKSSSLVREISTKIYIESLESGIKIEADAIWDTGAELSLISPEIVTNLRLIPSGKATISTPTDKKVPTNVYVVNIHLPNNAIVNKVKVIGGTLSDCDILIGMDIITLGDFAVTNFNGQTTFTFRIPSLEEIDFSKNLK